MNAKTNDNLLGLQPDRIDLRRAVVALRKHKLKILLLALLSTLLVYLGLSTITPVYRSSATLLINSSEKTKVVSVEELISAEHTSENFLTQIEILRSRRLAQRVVAKMELTSHWAFNPNLDKPTEFHNYRDIQPHLASYFKRSGTATAASDSTLDSGAKTYDTDKVYRHAVSQLLARVNIVPVKDTTLVRIRVSGEEPDLATKIANEYGTSYIDDILETKRELNGKASAWLDEKLVAIKEQLALSESRLVEFREGKGLVDLGGRVGGLKEQRIAVLTNRRIDAERESRELKVLLEEINSAVGPVGSTAQVNDGSSEVSFSVVGGGASNRSPLLREYESLSVINGNPIVQALQMEMLEEKRKLDELSIRYGKKHPLVVSTKSNYDVATHNLDRQIESLIVSVRKQYELAEANLRSIEAQLGKEERATYDLNRQQNEMSQLEREVEANRNRYNSYLKRAKDTTEAVGITAVIASISDPATTPSNPVFPRTKFTLQLAFILSLVGFSFLALLFEKYRNTVQDVDSVISKLGLPMLGLVPLVRQKSRSRKYRTPIIDGQYADENGLFKESFKTIRSTLYLSSVDDKLIMVTSTLPSEGKSTVALNLAQSMSLVERVLLIEADMRRPTLNLIRKFDLGPGLSHHLLHDTDLDLCIKKCAVGYLDILPAGFVPNIPLELLTSAKFENLLTELSTRYDKIIIDTAPVGAVSDALMVGRLIDTTVFVTGADSTQIQDVSISLERLREAGIRVGGVVISKVDIKRATRYSDGYRGYVDTYGYAESKPAAENSIYLAS